MWHILKKIQKKMSVNFNVNTEFNSQFKSCVWNLKSPEEFELKWTKIISCFRLEANGWLSQMYDI